MRSSSAYAYMIYSLFFDRNIAIHALISTLSPADAKDTTKLSEEQVSKLSERLGQILGEPGGDVQEKRNERGEVRCLSRIQSACLMYGNSC